MLCAAGTRAGDSCNERPYSAVIACLRTARRATPDPDHPSEDAPRQGRSADGPTTICDVPQESTSAVPITPGNHPRDRRSIARGARRKPHDKWFRSWFPPRGSVRKRAPARVRPHRRATSPRSCGGRQRGGAAQGRFQNIGRGVLCTRAGESAPQAAIRRGWPPF